MLTLKKTTHSQISEVFGERGQNHNNQVKRYRRANPDDSNTEADLLKAAYTDDWEKAKKYLEKLTEDNNFLIDKEIDINNKNTLLHIMAQHGNLEAVKQLLVKNANHLLLNKDEAPPVLLAARGKFWRVVEFFLESDNTLIINQPFSDDKNTLLHLLILGGQYELARKAIIKYTIININAKNKDGNSPAFLAVIEGQERLTDLMMNNKYLKEESNFDRTNEERESFDFNKINKKREKLIFRQTNKKESTIFHIAAKHEKFQILKNLLDRAYAEKVQAGDILSKINSNDETVASLTLLNRNIDHIMMEDILSSLYLMKVSFTTKDKKGNTPLHLIAFLNIKGRTSRLVSLRVDDSSVNIANEQGQTPLHFLALGNVKNNNLHDVLSLASNLIKKGASIDQKDKGNLSPLEYTKLGHFKSLEEIMNMHNGKEMDVIIEGRSEKELDEAIEKRINDISMWSSENTDENNDDVWKINIRSDIEAQIFHSESIDPIQKTYLSRDDIIAVLKVVYNKVDNIISKGNVFLNFFLLK